MALDYDVHVPSDVAGAEQLLTERDLAIVRACTEHAEIVGSNDGRLVRRSCLWVLGKGRYASLIGLRSYLRLEGEWVVPLCGGCRIGIALLCREPLAAPGRLDGLLTLVDAGGLDGVEAALEALGGRAEARAFGAFVSALGSGEADCAAVPFLPHSAIPPGGMDP